MLEQQRCRLRSFDHLHRIYRNMPVARRIVSDGDSRVYEQLDPLSKDAFNYRDSIDIENHVSGVEIVKRFISKDGRILYLASSYGSAPVILKEEDYDVVSLDTDYNALRFASNYVNNQTNADAGKLPFIDDAFSAVVSRDFLAIDHYLLSADDQEAIVDEIHRVLWKGGKAIFYTLYTTETEQEDGKPIAEGLPDISGLLKRFDRVQEICINYEDRAGKNTIVYIATK